MNDVTILTPLPESAEAPVLLRGSDLGKDGMPLVPRDLFEQLSAPTCVPFTSGPCRGVVRVLPAEFYEQLHLVAVRFDLCDRNLPGLCAAGQDGRLRLVWQPLIGDSEFLDVGFHAFFEIPRAELAAAVSELRDIARMNGLPASSPLQPSPAFAGERGAAYAEALRSFVRERVARARLVRLTINAQPVEVSAVRWIMRGIERHADGALHEIVVPGSTALKQDIGLNGDPGFEVIPAADVPTGLAGALSESAFGAASAEEQATMLEALLAVDDPMQNAPDTVMCVACHVSTILFEARTKTAAPDIRELKGATRRPTTSRSRRGARAAASARCARSAMSSVSR